MNIILDGDIYAFRYAASNEEWMEVDGWLMPMFDLRLMRQQWQQFVEEQLPPFKKLVIAFSDSVNFRKSVCPLYKHKRGVKPVMYRPFVGWIKENHHTIVAPTLEADDVMGILGSGEGYTMISEDKDLKTIAGRHYDLNEQIEFVIDPFTADYFWMTQTLTGDAVDGYKGLPGTGPAGAEKILKGASTLPEMWTRVVEAYTAKGLTKDDALQQARLARILRDGDYDWNTNKVTLWKP